MTSVLCMSLVNINKRNNAGIRNLANVRDIQQHSTTIPSFGKNKNNITINSLQSSIVDNTLESSSGSLIFTSTNDSFTYAIFDIGKLFGMVAVNHNILEYVLIVWILSGGKINYSKWYAFFFIHLLIVGALTIFLKWPYDAIAFRIQGLTLDILLFIELTRTYFTTLHNLKQKNRIALVDDASFIHGLGNTINTFYYAQQTPYSLAYVLYAYYIYVDTRIPASPYSKKIIYLPNNSSYITFAIIVLTLSFSLLVVRISVLIESKHDNSD
ncbi:10661_t:CDS:2 [Entrophospora sp. SA101]|nr:10661_t:CDS:2 [Entrophospora sp. SA101]